MSHCASVSSVPRLIVTFFIIYVGTSCVSSHWVQTSEFFESLKTTIDAVQKFSSEVADLAKNEVVPSDVFPSDDINKCVCDLERSAKGMNLFLHAIQSVTGPEADRLYSNLTTLLNSIVNNQGLCLDRLEENNISKSTAGKSLREPFALAKDLLDSIHESPNSELNIGNSNNIRTNALSSLSMLAQLPATVLAYSGNWLRGLSRRPKRRGRHEQGTGTGKTADIVVSKSSDGRFQRIQDAIDAAPSNSRQHFTIYVRSGVYSEKIEVPESKTNIRLIGDGTGSTVITGSNHIGSNGFGSFASATFAVFADGFVAKGITFENAAGPNNDQAVALRAKGDRIAFYACEFRAYQDTLLLEGGRQFFKKCTIRGTVDFICGDARAVFQDSKILIRGQPSKSYYTVTAHRGQFGGTQGGFVFQFCKVLPDRDYDGKQVYLGRPWKQFACTIFMQTYLSNIVASEGWHTWEGVPSNSDTAIYGEYSNSGPGAGTSRRVSWRNYMRDMSLQTARGFTVKAWLDGNSWLQEAGVPFQAGGL